MKKTANLEEMKKIEYMALNFLDDVCQENEIPYYLTYGTLIGAVRHQGFIPWDDDIDVIMFRKDYERFAKVMESKTDIPYRLLDTEKDTEFSLPFPKLCDTRTAIIREGYRKCIPFGIYIDIFILDNIPDDLEERKKFIKKINLTHNLWEISQTKKFGSLKNPIKVIMKFFIRCFPPRFYSLRLNRLAKKYKLIQTKEVCQLLNNTQMCESSVSSPNIYGTGKRLKFEQGEFPVPDDYDWFLRDRYGDYMQLPPENERVHKHDLNATFDTDLYDLTSVSVGEK